MPKCPEGGTDLAKVCKGFRPFGDIPQQRGGVICGNDLSSVNLVPLPMLLCDFESRADQRSCGYAAETHDDFRINQRKLALKPLRACFALIRCRIAVLRRPAFYDIADIDILPPQADQFQHHIQKLPCRADEVGESVWHIFPLRSAGRERLLEHLMACGVETMTHYPVPPHRQEAMKGIVEGDFPVTERWAEEELSLPIAPYLTDEEVERVIKAINGF